MDTDDPRRRGHPRRSEYKASGTMDAFIVPILKERIERVLLNELPPVPRQILDVGCGRQPFRSLVEGADSSYVGMDVVQAAERPLEVIGQIDGVLPAGLLRHGPFDFIVCTEVLEHVVDWATAFANLSAVLKPGGKLLITCPHFFPLHEEPHDFWRPTGHAIAHFAACNRLKVVRTELAGDGWDVIGTALGSCVAFPVRPGLLPRISAKLVHVARRFAFELIRSRWPQRLARLPGIYLCNVVLLEKE